jgi:hypothetical protein
MSGKPQSFKPANTTLRGGMSREEEEEVYRYKAQKYHYKCYKKLQQIMSGGAPCPKGYEKYLKPYQG